MIEEIFNCQTFQITEIAPYFQKSGHMSILLSYTSFGQKKEKRRKKGVNLSNFE